MPFVSLRHPKFAGLLKSDVFQPTMLQWIELLTKQFNACHAACEVSNPVSAYTGFMLWGLLTGVLLNSPADESATYNGAGIPTSVNRHYN